MFSFTIRAIFLAFIAVLVSADGGIITAPANGTVIMPGESFAFSYDPMADYGVSTYNYTVFLFTKLPSSLYSTTEWSSGHYFGRFDYPNYPGKFEACQFEYGLMELQRYRTRPMRPQLT